MSTNRKRKRRTPRGSIETLTDWQREKLLSGKGAHFDDQRDWVKTEGQAAWALHRKELIAYWQQDPEKWRAAGNIPTKGYPEPQGPDSMPWGYWEFDNPEKNDESD